MEHTALPWKAKPSAGKQWQLIPHYNDFDRRAVATLFPGGGEPHMDTEADARFIERAANSHYEMLEALEREHGRQHFRTKFEWDIHNACLCEDGADKGMPHPCHTCAAIKAAKGDA